MALMGIRRLAYCVSMLGLLAACGDDSSSSNNPGGGGSGGGSPPDLTDTDGDGIADIHEGEGDADGDGLPNTEDTDSDGDGIPDQVEAGDDDLETPPEDDDNDDVPNFLDDDSDGNGILDADDSQEDFDSDGNPDFSDVDDDNDGLTDGLEMAGAGADCDGDGTPDAEGTPVAPFDCEGDGADYQDIDSDGDGIGDRHEEDFDADQDGVRDRFDADTDADTIPDSVEAGDDDVSTAPVDSDSDGTPDFRDPDSDNDGLSDLAETEANTDPTNADSDSDGVNDLVEVAAGTDPLDGADNPQANGDFVFVVPYQEPTMPPEDTLEFRTSIQFADVYFTFDTTTSMNAELAAMKNAVTGVPAIVDQVTCDPLGGVCLLDQDCPTGVCFQGTCIEDPNEGQGCIPDLWTGVGRWDELNTYRNLLSLQPDPVATANAVPGSGGGANEAPYQPSHCIANPSLCPGISNMNCAASGIGCPGYRQEAIRIYVQITDADQQCSGGACGSFTAASAGAALQSADIKFISLYGTDDNSSHSSTPQTVAEAIGNAANTLDQNGDPFVFLAIDNAVVTNAVSAILALAKGRPLNTTIAASDDATDAVDATQFIDYLEVNISGVGTCSTVDPVADTDADTFDDAFPALLPGIPVCWDLHPVLTNTTVPATDEPQLYKAVLTVRGDGSPLDSRDVYFLIPPKAAEIPPPPR